MKRIFALTLCVGAVLLGSAFYMKKDKNPPPSDGVQRHFKSKPVKKPVAVKLSDGLEYTVLAKGNGPVPKTGDRVVVLYKGMLTNDTVFDASYLHNNEPFSFHLNMHEVIAGWDSIVGHLHGGDKARMTIPSQYGYGRHNMGKIPPGSTLIFEVEIIDLPAKPVPWVAIGKDTITTPSGLKVIMFESHPENPKPNPGQFVKVHYSGFLKDSINFFDSSVDRGIPLQFPLGRGKVIKGWDEGIGLLHKGEKAKLIIPSSLGYGDGGIPGIIPPKATLIFDVELVDFK